MELRRQRPGCFCLIGVSPPRTCSVGTVLPAAAWTVAADRIAASCVGDERDTLHKRGEKQEQQCQGARAHQLAVFVLSLLDHESALKSNSSEFASAPIPSSVQAERMCTVTC